jgi:hypothetical protein
LFAGKTSKCVWRTKCLKTVLWIVFRVKLCDISTKWRKVRRFELRFIIFFPTYRYVRGAECFFWELK